MSIWLCPDCQSTLDRREVITMDLAREHDRRRCASCGRARLSVVRDEPEDDRRASEDS